MYTVVTGVAGFIGSHLAEAVLRRGDRVLGIDCFTDYYDVEIKRANLATLLESPSFELAAVDLRNASLEPLVEGAEVVFHQAGQPGIRTSFAAGFADYCSHNILGTQRLLEAVRTVQTPRFIFASSSSIYGNALSYPTREVDLPRPFSPYGVTKLAAEHLCNLYAANWGLSTVSLRYFTVYGPRQRPDMAMHRIIEAALLGRRFQLFGDGTQVRDFTYVDDVVGANVAAAGADVAPGTVVNIAGGSSVSMLEVIELVAELAGRAVRVERGGSQAGDVTRTGASSDLAREMLGWEPRVTLRSGLGAQVTSAYEMAGK